MAKITRDVLLNAYERGLSYAQIAAEHGVTKQAVYQMAKKHFPTGLPVKQKTDSK